MHRGLPGFLYGVLFSLCLALAQRHKTSMRKMGWCLLMLWKLWRTKISLRHALNLAVSGTQYCAACHVPDYLRRLVKYCGQSSDGEYYCEACWLKFRRGVIPSARCLDADRRPVVLEGELEEKEVTITDLKFPVGNPLFAIHEAQIVASNRIRMVDDVDIFATAGDLKQQHGINTDVDLMVFSAPHGILCDGSAHRNHEDCNSEFVVKAFMALARKSLGGLVVVPFAARYVESIEQMMYDNPCGFVRNMCRIPGWRPVCSNPSRSFESLCGEEEVHCIVNFPVEENVDLLKLFKEAGSVVFFGSFTCQLEMMLIKLDKSKQSSLKTE